MRGQTYVMVEIFSYLDEVAMFESLSPYTMILTKLDYSMTASISKYPINLVVSNFHILRITVLLVVRNKEFSFFPQTSSFYCSLSVLITGLFYNNGYRNKIVPLGQI